MIRKEVFGQNKAGETVYLYRVTNQHGNYIEVINYGCRIHKIMFKDNNGELKNLAYGCDCIENYEKDILFLGATVGRCGNRIAKGRFELNGKQYQLSINEEPNHIHGGFSNFSNQLWDIEAKENALICKRTFGDGEEGYPGELNVTMTYEWTDQNQLKITYHAEASEDTIINLTNHAYFNLSGNFVTDILNHELIIPASLMTDADAEQIPSGEFCSVEGTPFDFREVHTIGERIDEDHIQLKYGKGYDHNYVFEDFTMKTMAVLRCPESGITMTCASDLPGMQLYTGNNMPDFRRAVCLETQNYPDAINHSNFPSPILRKGEDYDTTTIYTFEIKE